MAANPSVVPCPKDVWTKVADNVTSAVIHKLSLAPGVYKQTYKLTGEGAPADDTTAIPIFDDGQPHIVSSDAGIDVYMKCSDADGSVRLDL